MADWLVLPVYLGADGSEYAPWALLVMVPLFTVGICVSGVVILLVRKGKSSLVIGLLAILLIAAPGVPRRDDRSFSGIAFLPAGKQVLATFGDSNSSRLYAIALDTGRATRFTTADAGFERGPSFSPDGKRVVYSAGKALEQSKIMIANIDGSDAGPITAPTDANDSQPMFATDAKIVFVRSGYFGSYYANTQNRRYTSASDLIDLATGNLTQLTDNLEDVRRAAVSPDGQDLIFVMHNVSGDEFQIYSIADRSRLKRVIHPRNQNILDDPAFDPKGRAIFFLAASTGKDDSYDYDIYHMDLATENVEKLTSANGYTHTLRVSPDGTRAIFVRESSRLFAKRRDMVLVDLTTRRETILNVKGIE